MLAYFDALGERIASEWAKFDYDSLALPQIAADRLSASPPSEHVQASDIVAAVIDGSPLPPQPNLDVPFGEPPLTVYTHEHFYIEALFWVTGTTTVHQHSFSGAFSLLHGSSLQSRYDFEPERRINAHLHLGKMSLRDVKLLTPGCVEPIVSGTSQIHSVFHLERPSVSVVVRTATDVDRLPQYDYWYPYVAINPRHKDTRLKRTLQVLELINKAYPQRYQEAVRTVMQRSDLLTALMVIKNAFAVLRMSNEMRELIEDGRRRHGDVVDNFLDVVEEGERRSALIRCREGVVDPELRFFIALLLTVPSRKWLMKLLAEHCPGVDVCARAMEMASELAQPLFGVPFDALDQQILIHLMSGGTVEGLLKELAGRYGEDAVGAMRENIIAYCFRLGQTGLKSLLTEGQSS